MCVYTNFSFFFSKKKKVLPTKTMGPPYGPALVYIIIIKTFYMSSCSNGENFVSIRQTVAENNTKVLNGQTDRQTDRQTNKKKTSCRARYLQNP